MTEDYLPPPPSGTPVETPVPAPQNPAGEQAAIIPPPQTPTEEQAAIVPPPPPPSGAPLAPEAPPQAPQPTSPLPPPTQVPEPIASPPPTQTPQAIAPHPATQTPQAVYSPATAQTQKKKSKKPLIIGLSAGLAVILIVVGIFVGMEVMRSNTYNNATNAFDQGNYQQAYDGFSELGDYRDSASWLTRTSYYLTYEQAIAHYEESNWELARSEFSSLESTGEFSDLNDWLARINVGEGITFFEAGDFEKARELFSKAIEIVEDQSISREADEWRKKALYAIADESFTNGDLEGAYYGFKTLGSQGYSDAASRAESIAVPFPGSGIVYQADGSYYEFCALEIVYNYAESAAFYKIYNGSNLVASVFMNGISTVRVYLQPGTYTIKEGTGDTWFGPDLAFGDRYGSYSTMTFNDSGTETFSLEYGNLMTLTINTTEAGNVGSRDEDRSSF